MQIHIYRRDAYNHRVLYIQTKRAAECRTEVKVNVMNNIKQKLSSDSVEILCSAPKTRFFSW